MAIPVAWVCTKCGLETSSSVRPGTGSTSYSRCKMVPYPKPVGKDGGHHWVRKY